MKIIVVGIGCVGAKYLPAALRDAGHEPVVVADPRRYVGAARAALESCRCLPADITDPEDVARALATDPEVLTGPAAITSPFDETFPVTQRVADKYGLAHPPPVFADLADKSRVAALVPEYSPATTTFHPREIPADLGDGYSGPVLLKPSLCTGALGIHRLDPVPDREALAGLIAGSGVPGALDQPWLLQQVVDGDLISLEGYVRAGELTVVGFSRRTRIGATEVANHFPAADTLPPALRRHCVAAVTALVDASGFRDGYLHCEFLATGDRAYLIDANAGRLGGAAIVEQIALAHDIDPAQVLRHALLLPLVPDSPAPAYRPPAQAAPTTSYWYGLRDGGVVRSVSVPADTPCRHTQFARPGQRVPAVGVSDYAWIGMFTGRPAEADRDIARVVVQTDRGAEPACYR